MRILGLFVLLILLLPAAIPTLVTHSPRDLKLPASQSTTLPGGYFVPIEIDSLSNNSWLAYQVQSNLSISIALMNSGQFNTYNNSQTDDISNSITYTNGTTAEGDLQVSFGPYFLVLFNGGSLVANVSFTYITYPFTPYVAGPLEPPEPMGLASFGLYNVSNSAVPYSIETSAVVGAANITSIQAYNSSAPQVNDTVSGATLQLNALLVAENNDSQQVYWIQNTPDFVTNASQVSYNDNAWNNSDLIGPLSNQSVSSPNGPDVFPTGSTNESAYYYAYGTNNYTYALPFDADLLLNESVISGQSVVAQLGMQILRNGSVTASAPITWFDNITLSDPGVQKAYYLVDGNDSTPVGSFYDAELVFGGEGNLEATSFTHMNATLGLYYFNSSTAQLSPFPSYYSFGGDTGESADNLHVTYLGNGTAQVGLGTPNYAYLGTISSIASTSSSSRTTTTSSSLISSYSSGASEFTWDYFLVLIPAVLLSGALVVLRRRHQQ